MDKFLTMPHIPTLTRADITNSLEKEIGLSSRESAGLVNAIIDHITTALSRGETVKLAGFGVFSVTHKKERLGRNPKTGEEARINARYVVSFKPSPKLKHRVETKHRP